MNFNPFKLHITYLSFFLSAVLLCSCGSKSKKENAINNDKEEISGMPNDVIPFFQHWNLILGDGSNVGQATKYENNDFFYATNENNEDWVVFKTPKCRKHSWDFKQYKNRVGTTKKMVAND